MLKITWLGQGGYMLNDGVTSLCIDPYLSNSVFKKSGKKRLVAPPIQPHELSCDVMVCTHNHLDHVDPDTISVMKSRDTTVFLAPVDCEEKMRGLGVVNYQKFDDGDLFEMGSFRLEAVFADHTSKSAIGVVVRHGTLTLLFSGDTFYNQRLRDYKRFGVDILFVCINGKLGNMNVDEAVKLTGEISAKVGVPTHYGMFAENTEDPKKYISRVSPSFEMKVGVEYGVYEIMELAK